MSIKLSCQNLQESKTVAFDSCTKQRIIVNILWTYHQNGISHDNIWGLLLHLIDSIQIIYILTRHFWCSHDSIWEVLLYEQIYENTSCGCRSQHYSCYCKFIRNFDFNLYYGAAVFCNCRFNNYNQYGSKREQYDISSPCG